MAIDILVNKIGHIILLICRTLRVSDHRSMNVAVQVGCST